MRSSIVFAVFLTLFGLGHAYVTKTVYQYLVDNGYSDFVQLVNEAHMDNILSGPGPITVFAPTNTAVKRLDPDLMASFAHSPHQQSDMVKYHVADGFLLMPELADRTTLRTHAGQDIQFLHIGHSTFLNNNTRVDSAPHNDIVCTNGVIQPIDHLLVPPLFSTDNLMATLIERDTMFQEFTMAMLMYNLTTLIEGGEFTIFAPVDAAFAQYANTLLHPRLPMNRREEVYTEIFKYHIVPGERPAETFHNGQQLFTIHGTPLTITVMANGDMLADKAHITQPDIPAANGVIHAIDHLLFPGDLLAKLQAELAQHNQGSST